MRLSRLDLAVEVLDLFGTGSRVLDGRYPELLEIPVQGDAVRDDLLLQFDRFLRAAGDVEFSPSGQFQAQVTSRRDRRRLALGQGFRFFGSITIQ